MNNLLSYCGLVDARIRASNKDLPVSIRFRYDVHLIIYNICKCQSDCYMILHIFSLTNTEKPQNLDLNSCSLMGMCEK